MPAELEKENAAPSASVGADAGQQFSNKYDNTIPDAGAESNENFDRLLRKMRQMNNPDYLHTVSLNELFDNVYESRPSIIDGLLYAGAYFLAGAPNVGKSFLMAQLTYHVARCSRGRCSISHWKTTTVVCRDGCRGCSVWAVKAVCSSRYRLNCFPTGLTAS